MVIVLAVILIVLGAVLLFGLVDLPTVITDNVDEHTIGAVLLVVGILAAVLSVMAARRGRERVIERR